MELVPGAHVTPELRLVRPLAEGAMGHVWIAEHRALGSQVAVKFLRANLARRDPTTVDRFRREVQAVTCINSAHVVQIFDHGTADGTVYLVMELLSGETLARRLSLSGPFPAREILSIAEQTAGVLEQAHALGIVHRDIKPENLFLTESEQPPFVKVLDFGLAKLAMPDASELTATGALLGTPAYMSPEQLRSSKNATPQDDLWALAVTVYKMLTGRLPFEAPTMPGLALAVCSGEFAPLAQYRGGLPAALSGWFRVALAKDPERRFPSAQRLLSALSEALELDPTVALTDEREVRGCLDDEELLAMGSGRLSERQLGGIERHLDDCAYCCELVGAALQAESVATGERPSARPGAGPLPTGFVAAQRYRIERCVASGPARDVYDATDLVLQERVALQSLPAALDEPALRELLRAQRRLQRIAHAHVCQVYDVCLYVRCGAALQHLVTMEFIDGESLRELLRRAGALPLDRALSVLRPVLQGLAALHAAGVVHGDLRPANIVLHAHGGQHLTPILVGAGLEPAALQPSSRTSPYTAPELQRAEPAAPAADLFAWGSIAFELLTGRVLSPGDSLASLGAELPAPHRDLLHRCLAPHPAERPASAEIILAELVRSARSIPPPA